MAKAAKGSAKKDKSLDAASLLARASWGTLPNLLIAEGDVPYFRDQLLQRFSRELFGEDARGERDIRRYRADREGSSVSLATILDELRTPSFFCASRLVVLESAGPFFTEHGEVLSPLLAGSFSGGHLFGVIDGNLDRRTRFARGLADLGEKVWVVRCAQPFNRPPPWETGTPAWESDLSRWVVSAATALQLEIDLPTAFLLHERVGVDLRLLEEELGKLATYLRSKGVSRVDAEAVLAVTGDTHEDTVFAVVETFLEGDRAKTLDALGRLFDRGFRSERGTLNLDPSAITLMFSGALLQRLRALRRAHSLTALERAGPDRWVEAGIVHRPFLAAFRRQVKATPPQRLIRLIDGLFELDLKLKLGGDPRLLLELLVSRS